MGKQQKCILCEIVYSSKQEMDEHIRSMLHHRELENMKGRDCGHECRVCKVTVVSLTDYADHISSPVHKKRVEAQKLRKAGSDEDEEYFDKELVDLIAKKKEQIRQEEAAAKRAKEVAKQKAEEDERRRKLQKLQQRWNEAKKYVTQKGASWGLRQNKFQLPTTGAWSGSNSIGGHGWGVQEDPRNWHQQDRQGRSATWHAQEPPNFQNWGPGERAGGSVHSHGNWRGQPWLSNEGGINTYDRGNYGSGHRRDFASNERSPSCYFNNMEGWQNGHEKWEGPSVDRDRNNGMGPKTFGSNPKLDKACRWSPYPPTKHLDSTMPHNDAQPTPSEKFLKAPPAVAQSARDGDPRSRCEPAPNPESGGRQTRWDKKRRGSSAKSSSNNNSNNSSSSRSSSTQRDGHTPSVSSEPPKQKPGTTTPAAESSRWRRPGKLCPAAPSPSPNSPKIQHGRTADQDSVQSSKSPRPSAPHPKLHNEVPTTTNNKQLPSEQEQQLAEMLQKAKDTLLHYKRCSVDLSGADHRKETVLHIEEEQQADPPECEGSASRNGSAREKPLSLSTCIASVQSVQVSTSTVEKQGTAASARKEGKERTAHRVSAAADEAMQAADPGPGSDSDVCRSSDIHTGATTVAAIPVPAAGLPLAAQRDLTKHVISTKSKTGTHEPNLNIARRIRSVWGPRKADTEKDSGLKPTVRQLISSSGSRRNINWEQVYQEVGRKKQEQGKGMPRFGIEMVPCDQDGLSQEEDDLLLTEGFQWESLNVHHSLAPGTTRKRSLSESSVVPESSLFPPQTPAPRATMEEPISRPNRRNLEQRRTSASSSSMLPVAPSYGITVNQQLEDWTDGQSEASPLTSAAGPLADLMVVDSSSRTEQNDALGSGKRRRAAGDIPSPEILCIEKTNKRRKKSKKERLQVDQLLAVSLREEELSRDLQTLDQSLNQARAALQAAYMEVQRLLVVKQQVTMEMSSLRTTRIELLQGMQGISEDALPIKVKEVDGVEMAVTPHMVSQLSPMPDAAATSPSQTSQAPLCETPPTSSSPTAIAPSVVIKQEPVSPGRVGNEPVSSGRVGNELMSPGRVDNELMSPGRVDNELVSPGRVDNELMSPGRVDNELMSPGRVGTEPEAVESIDHRPHSTTPDLNPAPSYADLALICQPVTVTVTRLRPTADWRLSVESSPSADPVLAVERADMVRVEERGVQATSNSCLPVESKPPHSLLSPTCRRGSQAGTPPISPAVSPPQETSPAHGLPPSQPPPPFSTSEPKSGKRVRKLKKKRTLRKNQAAEQLPDSDTDPDEEGSSVCSAPIRRLHHRRRSSGFQVSTSTSPSTLEDKAGERGEDAPPVPGASLPTTKPAQEDSDSALDVVEVEPRPPPPLEVVNIDTSSDSNMDTSPASPESEPVSCQPSTAPPPPPDTTKELPQNLACNEVSSTSEMEVAAPIKTSDSDVRLPLTSLKLKTRSADVLSDCGEELKATEGSFEGHKETVNAMQIHNGLLYTCSGDRTVKAFDLTSRKCVAVFEGHTTKVNCLVVSTAPRLPQRLYSGSSDQTIRCYSLRSQKCLEQLSLPDRVLCLHSRWNILYAGLANGSVVTFSIKTNKQVDVFECHGPRAVSCLATAQEGARRVLLVGSYDSTISVRDAKNGLLLRTLEGHAKTVLCMKVVNDLVFSGSSDQTVHAHNIHTGQLMRIYKGHSHAVTVVAVLGKVMVTACLDKLVRVYELQSHDRLQVYGGHTDMVMCMAIHKGMIYTGCYDGSVRAVKLNLMQNYRCLWHGCSLIFGVQEHLQEHLLNDHSTSNFKQLKCRWKNCDEYFTPHNCSTQAQGLPSHMQRHADESQPEG